MKISSYNLENLFMRAVALNGETLAEGKKALQAQARRGGTRRHLPQGRPGRPERDAVPALPGNHQGGGSGIGSRRHLGRDKHLIAATSASGAANA